MYSGNWIENDSLPLLLIRNGDPKGPVSKKMHTYVARCARYARLGYENGRGSIKHKRENKNHENFFRRLHEQFHEILHPRKYPAIQ